MQFIDLKRQFEYLRPAIEARINGVLEHGRFILGPEVQELEQALATYCNVSHVIGVANGTDALQLALMAADIGPGDAVFTSAFSFFASAEVISLVGATPVFVDIDERSYNICPEALAESVREIESKGELRPRCIIAVDLFGLPADYAAITPIADQYGLVLVEDAAQSFGGSRGGRRSCSFGTIAATSFFPAKPLGCFGDGGAVFTNDDALAEKVRSLRVHGKGKDKYDNVRIGLNSRLDTIQAAILLAKFAELPAELEARQRWADEYTSRLGDNFLVPEVLQGARSAWAQYTVRPRSGDRRTYMRKLSDRGVPTAIYYGKPLHLQQAFAYLGGRKRQYPVAERCAESVFSLPMHPYLEPEEVNRVATALLS
jgi:dTDP-4-amino-4,6-dideoxygalactose transaminase